MGWIFTHRAPGMKTDEFFRREFPTMLDTRGHIVASTVAHGVFYAAVREHETGEVWALVVLTQRTSGYHNYGYKTMSETMGPGCHDAPNKVLNALTPTDNQHALRWRAACRAKLALPKVTRGSTVRFVQSITFTNGAVLDTLTFLERNTFTDDAGSRYSLPGWRTWKYTTS